MQNLDSILAALNWAYKSVWPIWTKQRLKRFRRCWGFHDLSLNQRRPLLEIPWRFKIAGSDLRWWRFSVFAGAYGCWIMQLQWFWKNGAQMRSVIAGKIENHWSLCTALKRRGMLKMGWNSHLQFMLLKFWPLPIYLGNFLLSQQQLAPFELCLEILYQFNTSKHWIESSILHSTCQGCQIWIWPEDKDCTYGT